MLKSGPKERKWKDSTQSSNNNNPNNGGGLSGAQARLSLQPQQLQDQYQIPQPLGRKPGVLAVLPVSKGFLKKVTTLIDTEESRAKFFEALRNYHQSRDVKRLIRSLKEVLTTERKTTLFRDVRALIPEEHLHIYDRLVKLNKRGERLVRIKRRNNEPMGFTVRGGKEHGIGVFVTSVIKGSVACQAGLKVADEIKKINGLPLFESIHDEVVAILRTDRVINLLVRNAGLIPLLKLNNKIKWAEVEKLGTQRDNEEKCETGDEVAESQVEEERLLSLNVNEGVLGFSIDVDVDGNPGVFVVSVEKDSTADRIDLRVGDQLLNVCGTPFDDVTYDEALQCLQSNKTLLLTVLYNKTVAYSLLGDETPRCGNIKAVSEKEGDDGDRRDNNRSITDDDGVLVHAPDNDETNFGYPVKLLDGRNVYMVEIEKGGALGMKLESRNDKIVVHQVMKGGSIEKHGYIRDGDWIMSCEDYDMVGMPLSEAQVVISMIMQRCTKFIEFIVAVPPKRPAPDFPSNRSRNRNIRRKKAKTTHSNNQNEKKSDESVSFDPSEIPFTSEVDDRDVAEQQLETLRRKENQRDSSGLLPPSLNIFNNPKRSANSKNNKDSASHLNPSVSCPDLSSREQDDDTFDGIEKPNKSLDDEDNAFNKSTTSESKSKSRSITSFFSKKKGPPSSSQTSRWKDTFKLLRGKKHRKEMLQTNPPLSPGTRQKALSVDTIDYDGYCFANTNKAAKSSLAASQYKSDLLLMVTDDAPYEQTIYEEKTDDEKSGKQKNLTHDKQTETDQQSNSKRGSRDVTADVAAVEDAMSVLLGLDTSTSVTNGDDNSIDGQKPESSRLLDPEARCSSTDEHIEYEVNHIQRSTPVQTRSTLTTKGDDCDNDSDVLIKKRITPPPTRATLIIQDDDGEDDSDVSIKKRTTSPQTTTTLTIQEDDDGDESDVIIKTPVISPRGIKANIVEWELRSAQTSDHSSSEDNMSKTKSGHRSDSSVRCSSPEDAIEKWKATRNKGNCYDDQDGTGHSRSASTDDSMLKWKVSSASEENSPKSSTSRLPQTTLEDKTLVSTTNDNIDANENNKSVLLEPENVRSRTISRSSDATKERRKRSSSSRSRSTRSESSTSRQEEASHSSCLEERSKKNSGTSVLSGVSATSVTSVGSAGSATSGLSALSAGSGINAASGSSDRSKVSSTSELCQKDVDLPRLVQVSIIAPSETAEENDTGNNQRPPIKIFTQSDIEAMPSSTEASPHKSSNDERTPSSEDGADDDEDEDEDDDDNDDDTIGDSSESSDPNDKINFGQPFSYMTPSFPVTSPEETVDFSLIKEKKMRADQELQENKLPTSQGTATTDESISRASLKTLVSINSYSEPVTTTTYNKNSYSNHSTTNSNSVTDPPPSSRRKRSPRHQRRNAHALSKQLSDSSSSNSVSPQDSKMSLLKQQTLVSPTVQKKMEEVSVEMLGVSKRSQETQEDVKVENTTSVDPPIPPAPPAPPPLIQKSLNIVSKKYFPEEEAAVFEHLKKQPNVFLERTNIKNSTSSNSLAENKPSLEKDVKIREGKFQEERTYPGDKPLRPFSNEKNDNPILQVQKQQQQQQQNPQQQQQQQQQQQTQQQVQQQQQQPYRKIGDLKSIFNDPTSPTPMPKAVINRNTGRNFVHEPVREIAGCATFSPGRDTPGRRSPFSPGSRLGSENNYFNIKNRNVRSVHHSEADSTFKPACIGHQGLGGNNHIFSNSNNNFISSSSGTRTSQQHLPHDQMLRLNTTKKDMMTDIPTDTSSNPSPRSPLSIEVKSILLKHRKNSPKKVKFNTKVKVGMAYYSNDEETFSDSALLPQPLTFRNASSVRPPVGTLVDEDDSVVMSDSATLPNKLRNLGEISPYAHAQPTCVSPRGVITKPACGNVLNNCNSITSSFGRPECLKDCSSSSDPLQEFQFQQKVNDSTATMRQSAEMLGIDYIGKDSSMFFNIANTEE